MKCFLCGAKYDPKKKPSFTFNINEKPTICRQVQAVNGKVIAMCGKCTKAFVCGLIYGIRQYDITNFRWIEEFKYEEQGEKE